MLIDSQVRIILECQNRTINRGPNSIFSRLRREGIDVSTLTPILVERLTDIYLFSSPTSISLFFRYAVGRSCVVMC
jgi:hypothetical protein